MGTPRSFRLPSLVLLTVLLANCGDRITDPADARIAASGFHPAGAEGAHLSSFPRVYFLPPLVPPSTFDGTFDATLLDHLAVEICRVNGGSCSGAPLVVFRAGQGANALRIDVAEQHYTVNWQVSDIGPGDYRLNLRLGTVVIGGLALRLGNRPQDLRNLPSDVVGVHIGRTIPVKFRIEQSEDAPVSLTLSPASAIVLIGGSQRFTATVLNSDGTPRPGETVTWTSSNDAIATVDATGLATGHSTGSVTITAAAAGLSATATLDVRAPDLSVRTLTAPSSVILGKALDMEATVANTGTADAAAARFRFRVLNAETDEEVASISLEQPAIAAGATATVSTSITPTATWPRSLVIEATADVDGTVTESDETNNKAVSADIAFTAPDLTVAVTPSSTSVLAGTTFDVAAKVTNIGTSGAAATNVRVRVLNAETNAELAVSTHEQVAVAAGEATTVTVTLTAAMEWPSSIIVEATTDAGTTVAEWDESNNTARTGAIAITRPDLTVGSITVPTEVAGGAALTVKVAVKNLGTGAAGATDLRVRVLKFGTTDEIATATVPQAAIAAGASLDVDASFTTAPTWPREIVVEATTDAGATIAESNETNNTSTSEKIGITLPDLRVAEIVVPASLPAGGTFEVRATIANGGTASAAAAQVRFRVTSTENGDEVATVTLAQDAVPAGGTTIVAASFTTSRNWPRQIAVLVTTDVGNTVVEFDETNNTERSAFIGLTEPDFAITSVTFSATSVGLRCSLGMQAVVRNVGGGDAPAANLRFSLRNSDGVVFASVVVAQPALAAGAEATLSAGFTAGSNWPGEVGGQAEADASGAVPETDETNNAGVSSVQVQARVVVPAGFNKMWVCGDNTSWTQANNWEPAGAPAPTHNVYIPAGVTQYPVLAAAQTVNDITIENGANVNIVSHAMTATGNVVSGLMTGTTGELNLTGNGKTLRGTVPNLDIQAAIALSGDATATDIHIASGRSLNVGAFSLQATDDFNIDATNTPVEHLVMLDAAGRVIVGDDMTVGGFTRLDAGAIHVRGNLLQNGAINALTPGGTKFIFDGTAAQDIHFTHLRTSFLRDVEIRGPAVNSSNHFSVVGQLDVAAGGVITQTAGSIYYATRVPDEAAAGGYRVPTSVVDGNVVMVRNVTLAAPNASIVVESGHQLNMAGFQLTVGGNFTVQATNTAANHILMTVGDPRLEVRGKMTVGGLTKLDVGTIVLRGNFLQNGAINAMIPTGTKMVLDGPAKQDVHFTHLGTSWFGDVDVLTTPEAGGVNFSNHLTIRGQLRALAGSLVTQTAGNAYYVNRVPEELSPAAYRVPTSVIDGPAAMIRNVTLASPVANLVVDPGHTLTIGQHTLDMAGNFTVVANNNATKHVVMTNAAGVIRAKSTTWGGATQLDAGLIHVRGNLLQNGAINALTPNGTKFIFDGTGPQDIHFTHLRTSWLRDVEIRGPAVNASNHYSVFGQLDVAAGGVITQTAGNTYYTTRVPDEVIAGSYRVPTSVIDGNATMVRNVTLAAPVASIVVESGHQLNFAGFQLTVGGNFTVQATNTGVDHVLMTAGNPRLEVRGNMTVGGRTKLDVGTIVLRGHFLQNGAINSMIPTGTKMVLEGPARQDVHFTHLGTSWFGDVDALTTVAAGGVRFTNHLQIRGQFRAMGGSLVTQSAGSAYYVNRVPEELSPQAYQVPSSVIDGPAMMVRDITLASPLANISVDPGHTLTVGEYTLDIAGNFSVAATNTPVNHVVMTNPAGVIRAKSTTWGGATQLNAGVIQVRGNLLQNGAINALTPNGTKFIFDGTGPQDIHFTHLRTSWLRDVEIRGPAVNASNHFSVFGQLDVTGGGVITQTAGNIYYTTRVPDEATAGSYRVPTSIIDGNATMVRNVTLAAPNASIVVESGHQLNMAGFQLTVGGNFTVQATNTGVDHVLMTAGNPRLEVRGHMTMGGRTKLDVGTIVLRGNFTQNGAINSMIPTGTLVTFDGDGAVQQVIHLTHSGSSWLGNVLITPAASVRNTNQLLLKGSLDLDGFLHNQAGTLTVQNTLFFAGSLRNDAVMVVGACVKQGGIFSGTGNNPCP